MTNLVAAREEGRAAHARDDLLKLPDDAGQAREDPAAGDLRKVPQYMVSHTPRHTALRIIREYGKDPAAGDLVTHGVGLLRRPDLGFGRMVASEIEVPIM
jgi:hypothetical protein